MRQKLGNSDRQVVPSLARLDVQLVAQSDVLLVVRLAAQSDAAKL